MDLKKGEVMVQVAQAYYGLILANQGKEAVADARTYLRDARERVTRLLAGQLAQRQGERPVPPGHV